MEPRIQYAKTTDGVSIGFYALGKGMPLVYMPAVPWSHLQLEWQIPDWRRWYERLAENWMLVRYDSRGTGLSERGTVDFSLDAQTLDLEAVIDRLDIDTFALFGSLNAGPVAIAYAARQPERVSHLVLWSTYAQASDWGQSPQLRALRGLVDTDWETYTETYTHIAWGWSAGEQARRMAAFLRETISQEAMQVCAAAVRRFNVSDMLPQVRPRTLVLHRRQFRLIPLDVARRLASQIPDARLILLEGTRGHAHEGDMESVASAIGEFLGEGEEAAREAEAPPVGTVHTILFTDIEGSTTLTQRLGDAKAQELLRTHNTIVRDALRTCAGSEIKHTGDGIMASFQSASQALQCAIAIQQAVAAQADTPIRVRIGLNAGEPVAEERDLFGTAVQLARRICDRAEPGQILASNVVRELAAGKGFLFSDHGDVELRGFEDPVRLYEVRWQESD